MKASSSPTWAKRLGAGVGLVALGVATLSLPASAEPEVNYGDINFDDTGSLTLHKHEFQAGQEGDPIVGDQGTATELPNPVSGVTFTAYPITSLALTESTDWDTLSELSGADATCPAPNAGGFPELTDHTLSTAIPIGPTDGDGVASTELAVGAYLVCETGFTPGEGLDRPAEPFIVTIPLPYSSGDDAPIGWLYDVHAYPKNTLAVTVDKTVEEQGEFGLGAKVTFPTTVGVPRIADDAQFTRYTVIDPMDPRLVDLAVDSVELIKDGATAVVDATSYTIEIDRNVLMVHFTNAGLAWLKDQGGADIRVTFSGTVDSLTDENGWFSEGEIYNRAYLVTDHEIREEPPTEPELPPITPPVDPEDPDPVDPREPFDPDEPTPPTVPSNEVTTNWGDIKLWKEDGNQGEDEGANAGLSGATFEVYPAASAYAEECTAEPLAGADPISVNGETQFESTNGDLLVEGLFVSDSENDPENAEYRCYVLKEVKAPAGYVLPDGDDALFAIAVETGATNGFDIVVPNVKQDVPELPLTGGQLQVGLMILGGALLVGGLTFANIARRRRAQA